MSLLKSTLTPPPRWYRVSCARSHFDTDQQYPNSDEEKLRTYIRIVRLLLEEEESGQAETYYTRAAVLIHSTNDKTLQLQYKLCQARLADFSRKFADAAMRYHELSWVTDIDDEERLQAL